ncbi:MAG TPA: TGS domain-containing protein [Candidatus Aenigmarchaeota archaeon]|nr:TGS domain-containing protein [Candidatus Aenigmarchaeota archaeon]
MVTNLPGEYFSAEEEYHKARSPEEKIRALKKMLSLVPKHKGTEKLVAQIRRKIALLKEEKRRERKGRRGIKKEGEARVVLFGTPNSGKSFLLTSLTGKEVPSTPKPFETQRPEVGMIDYDGVKIQLIELPSVFPGYGRKKGEEMSILYSSDLVVILGDEKLCLKEMEGLDKPFIVLKDLSRAREEIWKALGFIKVYPKPIGKNPGKAMALRKGATVREAGEKIHKDFVENFKFARLWREGKVKKVGLNYVLEDGDVIEFHTS